MEVQQFEQAILKMAFETDARITTASVAYYLGIPSTKANDLLETLLEQGVLELDSDDDGNLYYFVPNQGQTPSMGDDGAGDDSWQRLQDAADAAAGVEASDGPTTGDDDQQRPLSSSAEPFVTSVDDDADEQPSFSPQQHSPHGGADGSSGTPDQSAPPQSPPGDRQPPADRRQDSWSGYGGGHHRDGNDPYNTGSSRRAQSSRFEGVPDGVTSRLGRTDATTDSCGDASVVVENSVSCEPRPLANSQPTVTSCKDSNSSKFSTHQEYGGFGFSSPKKSTALAPTSNSGEMTLRADNHIEQPEHQPGMALLLSLILCGTGQIYNGEVSKGIIMLILSFLLWFVFLGWVVHIWSIVDAVVVAERINRKSGSSQGQN